MSPLQIPPNLIPPIPRQNILHLPLSRTRPRTPQIHRIFIVPHSHKLLSRGGKDSSWSTNKKCRGSTHGFVTSIMFVWMPAAAGAYRGELDAGGGRYRCCYQAFPALARTYCFLRYVCTWCMDSGAESRWYGVDKDMYVLLMEEKTLGSF